MSVTGWGIRPSSGPGTNSGKPTAAWSVLDSAVCYRMVESFTPGGGHGSKVAERSARALAAQLEAECAEAEAA